MGWWETSDGTGVIGDRPADLLGGLLRDALGDTFDVELFGGFLSAFGAALLFNPSELVSDTLEGGEWFSAEFSDGPPLLVPLRDSVEPGMLERDCYEALEACAFHYRLGPERLPTLAELFETLVFVSVGRVRSVDGQALELLSVRLVPSSPGEVAPGDPDELAVAALTWAAMRALAAARPPAVAGEERIILAGLESPDWRTRMTAVLAAGRLRLRGLSRAVAAVAVPDLSAGLRDEDRAALLALRDTAAARVAGVPFSRPVHPDPAIATRRAALLAAVARALDGGGWPAPSEPGFVIHALVEPDVVRASGDVPPQWLGWLG